MSERLSDERKEELREDGERAGSFAMRLWGNEMVSILDELAALKAIVSKLPVTADGVPIVPGIEVWCVRTARWKWIGERGTAEYRAIEDYTDYPEPTECIVAHLGAIGSELQRFTVVRRFMSFTEMSLPAWCYSSRAAAESAKAPQ